ncbi:MAG: DUF2116 family Zn-ribbon domain-containing protein [Spiribacter salinus]|uniref:DUF2116 family Zn-ribbon domain-containing protein n=1 Tax=Spiribacter salinus TaxID=1335746 RepID=A0A540V863_9GAMM|nr:MAG: DUF2116 family Zn-ribbon domain-containing protein [Spiribacter salinus]
MDDVDRAANLQADLNRNAATARKPESGLAPEGWCHECGEDVDGRRLFCNSECADQYEHRQQQRRQHG